MPIKIKNFIILQLYKSRVSLLHFHFQKTIYLGFFILGFSSVFVFQAFSAGPTYVSGTITNNTTWTIDNSPYVIQDSIAVASGVILTIDPGVVVKFAFYNSQLIVNGALNANGVVSQPIFFTSIKDDSVGGDTNNDGSATTPAPGDWNNIYVTSGGTGNLSYATIRFAGGPYANVGLFVYYGTLFLSNARLSQNNYSNLYVYYGTVDITASEIDNAQIGILQTGGTLAVSQSSVHDNSQFGAFAVGSPTPMNAQNNFWGDSTGPYHPMLNPTGIGNKVSDNVLFIPWLLRDPTKVKPSISNLGQFKSDGATVINEGGITTEDVVVFKATVFIPNGINLKLQVELKEFSQPFSGQDIIESGLVPSGSVAMITRYDLVDGQYHGRARAVDNQGNKSDWQEFGTPGNVDFEIKLVPLYTQVRSPYPSWAETESWFDKPYAKGVAGNYDCGAFIKDCGCAITSEVMVMRFYNIISAVDGKNVDPGNFNEWSINNNSYYSNGDVKWEKIKDYSKDQFGVSRLVYSGPVNSENKNILNSQLYDLYPAILNTKVLNRQGKLVDHFVVADGKLSATYTVKDPIYYLTKNLNQPRSPYIYDYDNHFVGLRLFTPITILPDSISVHFASPGELLFTDPLGRRLGKDPISNIEYNEIPNGVYYQESIGNPESDIVPEASKNIWIPEPTTGQYDIQVIGTETGSYTLSILAYDQSGQSKDIVQTGNILPDIIQDFELNYSTTSAEQTKFQRIVQIDIKPSSDPNSINCKNQKEVIPVVILTTSIFDAATVDADTVRFGTNGAQEIHKDKNNKAKRHIEDADKDGDLDLVLHFKFADTGIQCGDIKAILTGKTNDNFDIAGSDSIRTVQSEKQSIVIKLLAAISEVLFSIVQKIL